MTNKPTKPRRNTAGKLPKDKKEMPEGIPFKKGYDPRRNLNGRPKRFDEFRKLALDIAEQTATTQSGTPLLWNGQEVTFAEFILLSWVTDKKYLDRFAEMAYGKVPDELQTNSEIMNFIVSNMDLFTDGQLQRLKGGENPMSILGEVLREAKKTKK